MRGRVLVLLVLLVPQVALADLGAPGRPIGLFTPGPSIEIGLDGALHFGGEIALSQYVGRWGLGGAVGYLTPGRLYLEAQPSLIFGNRVRNLIVGLNPGFAVDVTASSPRYGAQATLWGNYAWAPSRNDWRASPLVPFLRAQLIAGVGATFTAGVMLKLPLRAH